MIDNYFSYYSEIEEYFVRKRKKNLLVSPLDWCLIEVWKENEIPLHIVFRGIDRSFESAAGRGKQNPTSLHYCHPAVVEAFEDYKNSTVGKAPDSDDEEKIASLEEPSVDQICEFLKHLRTELAKSVHFSEGFSVVDKRLLGLEEELSGSSSGLRAGDIDRELSAISTDLAESLFTLLDENEKHRFEADLKDELKIYKRRLSKKMFTRLAGKHRVRRILDYFDLPDFSLLGLEF
jgi:hypothetical protein